MKKNLVAMTFASLASMLVLAPLPASAWCILGFIGDTCGAPPSGGGGGTRPVPGPLVGAGLPVVAVGYGAYWLVRRYRRKSNGPSVQTAARRPKGALYPERCD
jgi:hypothetical protein